MGLARGELIGWTKGFSCPGVEGEDVVQLLNQAIARRGDVKIDVTAILVFIEHDTFSPAEKF